jgi:hypothetical protein
MSLPWLKNLYTAALGGYWRLELDQELREDLLVQWSMNDHTCLLGPLLITLHMEQNVTVNVTLITVSTII